MFLDVHVQALSAVGIYSLEFITKELLLLVVGNTFYGNTESRERLIVCDIKQTSSLQLSEPNAFAAICEFHLPKFSSNFTLATVSIRSSPSPSTHRIDRAQVDEHLPQRPVSFFTNSNDTIFVLTMSEDVRSPTTREASAFRFIIPRSILLDQMRMKSLYEPEVVAAGLSTRQNMPFMNYAPASQATVVPWTDWGRTGCRIFMDNEFCTQGPEYIPFGSRFAIRSFDGRRGSSSVWVLDFNQKAISRRAVPRALAVDCGENFPFPNVDSCQADWLDNDTEITCDFVEDTVYTPERASPPPLESSRLLLTNTVVVNPPTELTYAQSGVFVEDVESCLPYRCTTIDMDFQVEETLLTEDNVLLLNWVRLNLNSVCCLLTRY